MSKFSKTFKMTRFYNSLLFTISKNNLLGISIKVKCNKSQKLSDRKKIMCCKMSKNVYECKILHSFYILTMSKKMWSAFFVVSLSKVLCLKNFRTQKLFFDKIFTNILKKSPVDIFGAQPPIELDTFYVVTVILST